jgi:hypothetical protein
LLPQACSTLLLQLQQLRLPPLPTQLLQQQQQVCSATQLLLRLPRQQQLLQRGARL